jgi:hypothetical protein
MGDAVDLISKLSRNERQKNRWRVAAQLDRRGAAGNFLKIRKRLGIPSTPQGTLPPKQSWTI